LLECILKWTKERGLNIIPLGLDLSEKLVALTKERLPEYQENFFVGNGWDWEPPLRFDYVRTELVYVPESLQKHYIQRILDLYLNKGGKLLVTEYRSSKELSENPWVDAVLNDWGFTITKQFSGFYNNAEVARACLIPKH